jgi:thymidylate synthase (FAD)
MRADLIPQLCAGTDLEIANAARRSFDAENEAYTTGDARLIDFLIREGHWLPFRHPQLSFACEAPVFVARQLGKHQVGMSWSEISRRYKTSRMELWRPGMADIRKAPENAKQGTGGLLDIAASSNAYERFKSNNQRALVDYRYLLSIGVAPEQARAVLPQSMYVYWTWTGSLLAWLHLIRERSHQNAQTETREWVWQYIVPAVAERFPDTWKSITTHTGIRIPNDLEAQTQAEVHS